MEDAWRTPEGVSAKTFIAQHSMSDLSQHWFEKWDHTQIISHRFGYNPGNGLAENTITTFKHSTAVGLNNHETDCVTTANDGAIDDHDFSARRSTGVSLYYPQTPQSRVEGLPIVIRNYNRLGFAVQVTLTQDTIKSSDAILREARSINPHCTILNDCRNDDVITWGAHQSRHDDLCRFVLIMFYSFTIDNGKQFRTKMTAKKPVSGWERLLKLILNLYPEQLISLGNRNGLPAETKQDLINVGLWYLDSFAEAGIPLAGLVAMCSGINRNDVQDIGDVEVERLVNAEEAIIDVVNYARSKYGLKIGGGTRAYDVSIPQEDGSRMFCTFNLQTGDLVPWNIFGRRQIKEGYATPGVTEALLNPDFICTDSPQRSAFNCCRVAADTSNGYRHAKFDTELKVDN